MIKEPNNFWKYYSDNIMKPLAVSNKITTQVNNFLNLNIHSFIIDTNMVKTLASNRQDTIHPNGKNDTLECVKCHKEYDANAMFEQLQRNSSFFSPVPINPSMRLMYNFSLASTTVFILMFAKLRTSVRRG